MSSFYSTIHIDRNSVSPENPVFEAFEELGIKLDTYGNDMFSEELGYDAEPELKKALRKLHESGIKISGYMTQTGDYDGTYYFEDSKEPVYVERENDSLYCAGETYKERYVELCMDYLTCTTGMESKMCKAETMREAEWVLENIFHIDPKPIFEGLYWKVNPSQEKGQRV